MTPEQHAQRIRQLEFKLHKADFGMGLPRDYQRVLELRDMLEQARKEAARGKIIVHHEYPPIPCRKWDWLAYHDGEEDTGHYGWGATREEAIADLDRLDQERAEALGDAEHMDSDGFNEQAGGY